MSITVAQALQIDGLQRSEVRAGRTGLQRTIEHVLLFNDTQIHEPQQPAQVLYLATTSIQSDVQTQCTQIATLAECHSAGLVIQPAHALQLLPEAFALADRLTFPVIELAAGVPCADIINSVTTALLHEQNAVLERQRLFQQQLIDLMLRGFGLDQLVRATAERLRQPVLVLSAHNETCAAHGLDEPQRQQWLDLIARTRPTRARTLELPNNSDTQPSTRVWVCPLPGTQRPGWFATLPVEYGREAHTLVEQACAIVALELSKQDTVATNQRNRQADLLDQLLGDYFADEDQLLREASALSWDLRRCRTVIIVRGSKPAEGRGSFQPLRIVSDCVRQFSPASIVCQRGDDLLVLASLNDVIPAARQTLRSLSQRIHQAFQAQGERQCVIAIGSITQSPLKLGASYRAALGALRLRPSMPGTPNIVSYEDAQLLILLSDFAERTEVRAWLHAQLGALIDYDQRNKTNLVQTLESALDQGGVLNVTAEQLSIHPNTLKYRLQRIEEIIEHNPLSSPHRLAYHIATKLARLLA